MERLADNIDLLNKAFSPSLTVFIRQIEDEMASTVGKGVQKYLEKVGVSSDVLTAALSLKRIAGQLNVVIHALGILITLPYMLDADEVVESLSLGAGNTGKAHDLVTDRRIAEFKFIQWRGGSESIRQNNVFKAFLYLLWDTGRTKRQLFLTGTEEAVNFLQGGRALSSVLSKDHATRTRFETRYGNQYLTVGQFYKEHHTKVEIIDLRKLVPAFEVDEISEEQ